MQYDDFEDSDGVTSEGEDFYILFDYYLLSSIFLSRVHVHD